MIGRVAWSNQIPKGGLKPLIWLVQSDADTEPLDTTVAVARTFFLIWEDGLNTGPGCKTPPHPSYLADSLCPSARRDFTS